jgi:hypothetical protein
MPTFQRYEVPARAALEVLVLPQFADVIDENGNVLIPAAENNDWQVWDDIPFQRNVIDIYGNKNLLKRRDATCKIIYSSLGRTSNRVITTEKVYIAAENCQQELYQGAFRDWESRSDVFREKALDLIQNAAGADIFSNKWFGWTARPANASWSINKFNGIWHWIAADVTAGTIPAGQTVDLGDAATFTDAEAYAGILAMIDAQDEIMSNMDDDMKTIHVDKNWYRQIWRYLISIGTMSAVDKAGAAPDVLMVEGIKVKPKKWNPIISSIMGAAAHLGILTLDGNFIFGTDSKYGKGPNNDGPAMSVWYSQDDDVTRWELHLKAGTMLGAPGYAVVATSTGVLAQL